MVNKKVIEKLNDRELENYIKPDSRYVGQAIDYAYQILQSRGRMFDDSEKLRIQQLIDGKTQTETEDREKYKKQWDENMTEDESAVELYSNKVIWFFSIAFGVYYGGILQAINFFRLKNNKAAIISLLSGVALTLLQIYLLDHLPESISQYFKGRFTFTFFLTALGATGLFYICEQLIPKDLQYRSRSFVVPLIIALIIYTPLFYLKILEIKNH